MAQSKGTANPSPEQYLYFAYHLPATDRIQRFCLSEPNRHDFFMAYTFEDVGIIRALDEAIRAEGLKSWIGDLKALVSHGYKSTAHRGIRESDGFVLLASEKGLSVDLHDELEQALELNKLVFLLSRQPLSDEQINLPQLRGLQWKPLAHLESSYGFSSIARQLVHSLTYVRLLARALDWERQGKPNNRLLSLGDLEATQARLRWVEQNLEQDFAIRPVQRQFIEASRQHIQLGKRTDYFQGKPPEVFISYSSKDRDFVKQLTTVLRNNGFAPWVDWENIPVATNWRHEVEAGIRIAHTFLFVISPTSVWSEHCQWELGQARRYSRRIIPLCCCQDYEPQRLKALELDEFSYVPFEELPFEDAATKVITAIRTDLQDVKTYNRLYGKAYEWTMHQRDTRLLMDSKEFQRVQSWLRDRRQAEKQIDNNTQFVPLHHLQTEFIHASRQKIRAKRRQQWLFACFTRSGFAAALAISALARLGEVRALVASLEEKAGLDGLITALQAGKRLEEHAYLRFLQDDLPLQTTTALHQETLSVRELNRLDGHERAVFDVAFSPNGEMLVSAGEDHTIRPWTMAGAFSDPLKGDGSEDEEVRVIDYSSDGDFFVTGDTDSTVHLWSCDRNFIAAYGSSPTPSQGKISPARYAESLKRLTRYQDCQEIKALEHPGRISRVAISPGSQYVVSASYEGNAQLWKRTDNFTEPRILSHGGAGVWGLDFSPQDRILVTGDDRGEVKLWDLLGQRDSPRDFPSLNVGSVVFDIRFSQDGTLIAIGGENGLLKIWDWRNDRIITLPGHAGQFVRVVFSPKNDYLATADTDGIVILWKIQNLREALTAAADSDLEAILQPTTLRGHQDAIHRIQFSADGRYLASASLDDTVRIWLTADGALLDTIAGHQDEVLGISFSPLLKTDPYDENEPGVSYLASSSRDGTIRIWRINNHVRPLPHDNRIYDIAFRPDGRVLASGGRRNISLWRLSDYSRVAHIWAQQSGDIFSLDYNYNGSYLVAGDSTGMISLWRPDISTERPYKRWTYDNGNAETRSEVTTVRFSPDPNQSLIASAWTDGVIRFWSTQGKPLGDHSLGQPVSTLAFSPDGSRLIAAMTPDSTVGHSSQLGTIQIFQITFAADGQVELTLLKTAESADRPHQGGILTVAFNPADPTQFASGGEDSTIKLWDIEGRLLKTLEGHQDVVTRVDFSADGEMLSSSSQDSTVKLWQVESGTMMSSLNRHKRQVAKVLFDPHDGTRLASAGFDNRVLIWTIPADFDRETLQKLFKVGCESAQRYLYNAHQVISTGENEDYLKNLAEVKTFCRHKTSDKS
jgi:WD40 repeat protein